MQSLLCDSDYVGKSFAHSMGEILEGLVIAQIANLAKETLNKFVRTGKH